MTEKTCEFTRHGLIGLKFSGFLPEFSWSICSVPNDNVGRQFSSAEDRTCFAVNNIGFQKRPRGSVSLQTFTVIHMTVSWS